MTYQVPEHITNGAPEPMTRDEIQKAFLIWSYEKRCLRFNQQLEPFLSNSIQATSFSDGWLKAARKNLQLSNAFVAQKLEMTHAGYSQIERSELTGNITLKTLSKAAEAMDCELVYAIRPKSKLNYSRIIWNRVAPKAIQHPWIQNCDQRRRPEALASIVRKLMKDAEFRREMGWSQRIRG